MKTPRKILLVMFFLLIVSGCLKLPGDGSVDPGSSKPGLSVPTPASTMAVIHGTILSKDTNKPPEAVFYLAANSTANTEGVPAVLAFSNQSSPRAEVTEEGEFVFRDVEPGQYAMMLWYPAKEPYFVPAADGQDYLWVNAKAGELLEMGEVLVP